MPDTTRIVLDLTKAASISAKMNCVRECLTLNLMKSSFIAFLVSRVEAQGMTPGQELGVDTLLLPRQALQAGVSAIDAVTAICFAQVNFP